MKKLIIPAIFLILFTDCSNSKTEDIPDEDSKRIVVLLDGTELPVDSIDRYFQIKYADTISQDLTVISANEGLVILPDFDVINDYFEVRYNEYFTIFNGDLLKYELAEFLDSKYKSWYIKINTKLPDSSKNRHHFGLYLDEYDQNGLTFKVPKTEE